MGGAAGHMPHLYEDLNLKIGEIKNIARSLASGGGELKPLEKVDGQNIFFRWDSKSGRVFTARNSSSIIQGGMTPDEFSAKWKGHPGESAFMNGFKAIEAAIQSLSREELLDIFGEDGGRFANAEIMYSASPNLIVYDGNYIVLHNLQVVDPVTKKTTAAPDEDFQRLVRAIDGAESQVSEELWSVHGPQVTALQEAPDAAEKFAAALDSIVSPLGVGENNTLGDFYMNWLDDELDSVFESSELLLQDRMALLKRLRDLANGAPEASTTSMTDIAASATSSGKADLKILKKVGTKKYAEEQMKIALAPIERAVSDFAADILKNVRSAFIGTEDQHNASIDSMRERLDSTISAIESYSGVDAAAIREKLEKELTRLGTGKDSLSNVEGVVFEYPPGSGNLKKLTGNFAALNQIVGALGRKVAIKKESRSRYPSLVSIFFG